jgi:Glycosyl transferases group 1
MIGPSWPDVLGALHRSTRPCGMDVPCGRGIGILTFRLGADGVSHVVAQYVDALRGRPARGRVGYSRIVTITGPGRWPGHPDIGDEHVELDGFGLRNPVAEALRSPLLSGGHAALPGLVLAESERLAVDLGQVLDHYRIGQLVVVNVNSLPHNICASIATVLATERRSLRVLNICHNGWWEHGEGARAALVANQDDEELFKVVRAVSPWRSTRWHTAAPTAAGARRMPGPSAEGAVAVVSNTAAAAFLRCTEPGADRAALAEVESRLPATSPRAFTWTHGCRIVHPRHPLPSPKQPFVVLLPVRITQGKRIDRALTVVRRLMADASTQQALLAQRRRVTVVCAGPLDERGDPPSVTAAIADAIEKIHDDPDIPPPLRETFSVVLPFGLPSALATDEPLTMAEIYRDADVVLLTSERESCGLPILEAAASGTPLLCVPYAASHRDIYDAITGDLRVGELPADPAAEGWIADARRWLLDPTLRTAAIDHNRAVTVRSFGSRRLADDLDSLLGTAFLNATCAHRRARQGIEKLHDELEVGPVTPSTAARPWRAPFGRAVGATSSIGLVCAYSAAAYEYPLAQLTGALERAPALACCTAVAFLLASSSRPLARGLAAIGAILCALLFGAIAIGFLRYGSPGLGSVFATLVAAQLGGIALLIPSDRREPDR